MNVNERLEANAILDEFLQDSNTTTFNKDKAYRLANILPYNKESVFTFIRQKKSDSFSGYSPGVGNITVKNDKRETEQLLGNEPVRIGGYKIFHEPGEITVSLLWEDLDISQPSKRAKITYNKRSKEAKGIYLPVRRKLSLGFISMYFSTYKIWKHPV